MTYIPTRTRVIIPEPDIPFFLSRLMKLCGRGGGLTTGFLRLTHFFSGEATKPPTDVSPKAEEKKAENHFDEAVFDLSCQNVFCNFS